MLRRRLAAFAFSLVLGAAVTLFAQNLASISESELSGVIRSVNTAQATWKSKHGTYTKLQDLGQEEPLAHLKVPLKIRDGDTATIEDYQVRVVVSSDRDRYMTSLTKEDGCGVAMFSNESGVIYRAKAFGCE
jgi:hypothetical protein